MWKSKFMKFLENTFGDLSPQKSLKRTCKKLNWSVVTDATNLSLQNLPFAGAGRKVADDA